MLIGWVPADRVSYWPTAEKGRDGKIWQPLPPPHYLGELLVDLVDFFLLCPSRSRHETYHPPLDCTVSPHFSRSSTNHLKLFISLLCVTNIYKQNCTKPIL
jgi:hypothetical protein